MSSVSSEWAGAAVVVESWRDHDPLARELFGMALGSTVVTDDPVTAAADLYAAGARCVRVPDTVELCRDASATSARSLLLVRELTGRGVAVEWTARCADGCVTDGRFGHLYPPSAVLGQPAAVAAGWRKSYFPCRCVFRHGPGFLEVRDRRFGTLEMFTVDEPAHLATIAALVTGVPVAGVPADVLADLVGAGLVAEHAGHVWWLPVRVHRWPAPALVV
ncbi:DUF5825 family protein [Actinophytocola xanthii]|uniref:Uncharacterized protein n=1 Tax=Actinophytocola xanthii TaxID=1912961 RepID=A0A1Q8CPC0_9PSEU|nr:DUF5825 family protein [Actinophytocola xanthii]OLF16191.1 hypothetical protein BU204_17605 [Actinophytocola xanthii]